MDSFRMYSAFLPLSINWREEFMNQTERPPAGPICENMAAQMFAEGFSPEEYAARFAHKWLCFSLADYRYADPAIDAWILRLHDILFRLNGAPKIDDLRMKYLSPEERLRIKEEEQEEF
jgi:hypothetical protein